MVLLPSPLKQTEFLWENTPEQYSIGLLSQSPMSSLHYYLVSYIYIYIFVKQQEPAFPSIEKSIRKHLKLLHRDSELKELYPRNLFITSYKRPKNLKELLCPSKLLKKKQGIINNGKSFIKCEKECKTCERINPSGKFT